MYMQLQHLECIVIKYGTGDPRDSRSGTGSETGEIAAFASEAAKAAAASGSPRYT